MSSKDPNQPLHDILDSVKLIEEFTGGMTLERFREDPKTIAAVERKLLLIGEAAVRMGREVALRIPDVPWRNIKGMGNLLRHEYDRVDLQVIWQTVTDDLPPLKHAVQRALSLTTPQQPEFPSSRP